jgi:diguanylate cyclase (GGDEF)-like protein
LICSVRPSALHTARTPASRLGAVASLLASIGGLVIWMLDPTVVRSPAIAVTGIAAAAVFGGLYVFVPWERLDRRALLAPLVVLGVPAIAIACFNTGGMSSPYTYYFAFIPFTAAYICTRRELFATVAACALAAGAPLAYDGAAAPDVVMWLFVTTISVSTGVVFHLSQAHVRATDAQLRDMALRDPLTGVSNRRALELLAANEVLSAAQRDGDLSVLYLDLDRFKQVNDSLGHASGDRVLKALARSTSAVLRDGDVMGRLGGDEFAIVLPGAGVQEAQRVEARVEEAFEAALEADETLPSTTVGIGRACFPLDGSDWEELLHAADRRLLQAKGVLDDGAFALATARAD